MKAIINFLSTIGDVIWDIIDSVVEFFGMAIESITEVLALFDYMPTYLLYPLGATLTVLIVKMVVPGGGSG